MARQSGNSKSASVELEPQLAAFVAQAPMALCMTDTNLDLVEVSPKWLQTVGLHVSTFALASLPYLATVIVLVSISADQQALRRYAPASLGKPFFDGD